MAATMATMAILNAKCIKSPLTTTNSKPATIQPKPISLLSIPNLPTSLHAAAPTAIAATFFAALSSTDPALAAQQIADGGDNRGLALLLPIAPAIAWVLYNILQPALNQLNRMRNDKALVAGLGLAGLALAAPPQSEAAEIAAGDNRGTLLVVVVLPAIGWVLFNILQPALNQLNRMRSE